MRRGLLIFVLIILPLSIDARADTASKHAKVKELFQLTSMQNRMEQTKASALAQAQSYAAQQLASFELPEPAAEETKQYYQQLYALVATKYDWDQLEPLYEQVYVDLYTEEELDGIIEFYRSPAGRAFLSKVPEATKQVLAISQRQFDSLAPQIKQLTDSYVSHIKAQEKPQKE